MDQERIVGKVTTPFVITGKAFLKLIYLIGKHVHDKGQWRREHPEYKDNFMGEQKWFDLINSSASKNMQNFMNSEVNFDKVNEQFKDLGLVFATRDNSDGSTDIAWLSRDNKIAEAAIQKAMKQIVGDPEKFMDKVKKDGKYAKPKDQIKHFKKINIDELNNLKEIIGKTKPIGRSK